MQASTNIAVGHFYNTSCRGAGTARRTRDRGQVILDGMHQKMAAICFVQLPVAILQEDSL